MKAPAAVARISSIFLPVVQGFRACELSITDLLPKRINHGEHGEKPFSHGNTQKNTERKTKGKNRNLNEETRNPGKNRGTFSLDSWVPGFLIESGLYLDASTFLGGEFDFGFSWVASCLGGWLVFFRVLLCLSVADFFPCLSRVPRAPVVNAS